MTMKVLGNFGFCGPVPTVIELIFVNNRVQILGGKLSAETIVAKKEIRTCAYSPAWKTKQKKTGDQTPDVFHRKASLLISGVEPNKIIQTNNGCFKF